MTWSLVVLAAALLLAVYIAWTAGRLDRQHARVDAAWAALDAQLVRRAAAARALVHALPVGPHSQRLEQVALQALDAGVVGREVLENDLNRALRAALPLLPAHTPTTELQAASVRVGLARSFHNTAVKDTRSLRFRKLPRVFRLAGHRTMPLYFEIDDTAP